MELMADLFKDVVPAILQTKKKVITEENEKEYLPFMVNRALSYHYDCILHANEMNKLPDTDKLLQFHYLLNTIRSYKRPFQKWQKREDIDGIEAVKEYYNYSNEKAKEAMLVLSNDQIEFIKRSKGGLNDQSQRTRRGNAK
jgi:hypothetical protein